MEPGTKEWEMQFPPELRDPWIMNKGENDVTISSQTRIVAPQAAFSLNVTVPESEEVEAEQIDTIQRELEVMARFMVPRVQEFMDAIMNPPPPSAEIIPFRPKDS